MQGSENKEWLIKSSGEVKGPYTFEEVVQGIISKEFILVDEVSKHFNRWKYLRDETAFDKAILEHQNKEYSKGEKTFTSSGTDTLTEEIRTNVVSFNESGLLSNVKEHLHENEQARATHQAQESARSENVEIKNYAPASELRKEAQKQSSSFVTTLLVVVILAIGGYFFMNQKEKKISYDDIRSLAYQNMNQGNFLEAKSYLEKALAVNATNEELKFLLSSASIEVDDTVTAQRLLNDLVQSTQDSKLKFQSHNLLGIIHLRNFSLADALKQFEASLSINSKYSAAHYNKGVALYLENKFDLAHESFTQSLIHGGLDGNILLAMTEWSSRQALDLKLDGTKRRQVGDILNLLVRQSTSMFKYRQEMKVAIAYIYLLLNERSLMEKSIKEALATDPSLTSDQVVDVSYYRGLVTWDRLSEWVKKMKDSNPSNEDLKTLYGYSLFKGSEKLKGKDMIEGLLKSNYSNTSNQILHAYILMSLKRDEDAKAALAPIMHLRDNSLSFVLMGRICLIKKDLPCADLNFNEALRIEKGSLAALAGLAEVYFQQGDYKKAQEMVKSALASSPTYKPGLNVKYKIESLKKQP